jgi:hypothetical protein
MCPLGETATVGFKSFNTFKRFKAIEDNRPGYARDLNRPGNFAFIFAR